MRIISSGSIEGRPIRLEGRHDAADERRVQQCIHCTKQVVSWKVIIDQHRLRHDPFAHHHCPHRTMEINESQPLALSKRWLQQLFSTASLDLRYSTDLSAKFPYAYQKAFPLVPANKGSGYLTRYEKRTSSHGTDTVMLNPKPFCEIHVERSVDDGSLHLREVCFRIRGIAAGHELP